MLRWGAWGLVYPRAMLQLPPNAPVAQLGAAHALLPAARWLPQAGAQVSRHRLAWPGTRPLRGLLCMPQSGRPRYTLQRRRGHAACAAMRHARPCGMRAIIVAYAAGCWDWVRYELPDAAWGPRLGLFVSATSWLRPLRAAAGQSSKCRMQIIKSSQHPCSNASARGSHMGACSELHTPLSWCSGRFGSVAQPQAVTWLSRALEPVCFSRLK